MKKLIAFAFITYLFCGTAIAQGNWKQKNWIKESPQYVAPHEGNGYEFKIFQDKQDQKLFIYKGVNDLWKAHIIDHQGRKYDKEIPEDVNIIVYVFQDLKGGVYMLAGKEDTDFKVYKMLSSGFSWRRKIHVSGSGFTSYFFDSSTHKIYFATRRSGIENAFFSVLIFDIEWKKMDEADKIPWHSFFERPKGINKETMIHSIVTEISSTPQGVVLQTESGERYLVGKLRFGSEALGTKSTFEVKKL